ncbi:MAG TPA: TetR/AcrR family transcriptional regulator [Galbitalea sp.]|jgi:AcrR family transcriptional regulator|nr:TetR/AcrR family transcriptional regulator [Galbitalea sp.]
MPALESPGLRERKRVATRQAIQLAVLRLALDRGLEHVTVEEISRDADVSPRTFFNYFVSKEAAIVGDAPTLLDEDEVEVFVTGGPSGDLLRDLGDLIAHSADAAPESRDTMLLRRDLHGRYPHLFALRLAGMRAFEDELADLIEARLRHEAPDDTKDEAALKSRARLITLVAFGALRHAWACWADADRGNDQPFGPRLRDSFDQLEKLLVRTARA